MADNIEAGDFKFQSNLLGHSGCKIYLMEDTVNKRYFVRKISKNVDYNERLRLQCDKQKNFSDELILTPQIFSVGYTEDGLFYFDMEHIRGITLSEHIKKIGLNEISNVVNFLMFRSKNFLFDKFGGEKFFLMKIDSLKHKVTDSPLMMQGLEFLSKYNWNSIPQTFCHGDLTLENIIVSHGKFYFIDFLDSFFDSFILDIATIFQDVHCMWAFRFEKKLDVNTKIRLMILRDLLLEKMSENKISRKDVYSALLLKLIRIYPYANDRNTIVFLNRNVESVMNLILREEAVK